MIISPRTALPFNQQINDLLCRSVFRVKDKDGKLDGYNLEDYQILAKLEQKTDADGQTVRSGDAS